MMIADEANVMRLLADADPDDTIALLGHRIGIEALQTVLDTLGGGEIYLPSFDNYLRKLTRQQTYAEIYNRHNGDNTTQLAIEYEITPRRIQQIVASHKPSREVNDA